MITSILRAAAAASLMFTLLPTSIVFADAELASATPGPDDRISDVPTELVATFSEALEPERSSIEVRFGEMVVARGGNDPAEPTIMRAALPALEPGMYEVRWTTYSADDNHLFRGTYDFEVVTPSTPVPTSTTPATPRPSASVTQSTPPTPVPSSTPGPTDPTESTGVGIADVLVPIVVLAIALGVLASWIRRQRR